MICIEAAALFEFLVAYALVVKTKLRPQFIQALILDKEVSDRFMDKLNSRLV